MVNQEPHFKGNPRFAHTVDHKLDTETAWRSVLGTQPLESLAQVKGDFSTGLTLPDGRQLLAVDRFAVHPLCWRVVDGKLRFAERADALADERHELDSQAIFDYLFFHAIPSPRTVYRGIFRLPPGHALLFERGQAQVRRYWTPTFRWRDQSFDEWRSDFMAALESAVRRRVGDGRPACYLSGGTDSSTVAGLLSRLGAGRPQTYSIGFEAQGYDEMAYARIAAQHFGADHHEYYVTPADLVDSITAVATHFDQPFGNSSALPAFHCALQAQRQGVRHLLAGDGGDELFGGNSRYAKQRVFGWYGHVPSPLRRGLLEPMLMDTPLGRAPGLKKGRSYVEQARVPMPDRLHMYNLLLRVGVSDVLSPAFLARVDQNLPLQQQREVWQAVQAGDELDRTLAYDWRYTLSESDLPKVVQSAAMAGVTVGFPLLDDDLLDIALALPADYKLRGLKLRWFFKEALRGFLPESILTKPKHGFGLPFGVWAHQHPDLMALASGSARRLAARGVVNGRFVDQLLNQLLPQHPGYYGELLWIMMMLEQWLESKSPDFGV